MSAAEFPLYPAWRQAEKDLLEDGLTYGSVLTESDLKRAFNIGEPKSIADVKKLELLYLQHYTALRDSLLINRRMMLVRSRHDDGYIVVRPEHQTRLSTKRRTKELKRAMQKWAREISHVETALLDDAQRKENSDAQAKLGMLHGMFKKQLAGPK